MFQNLYHIAEINFTFITEDELEVIERMKPFLGNCIGEEVIITYQMTDSLILPSSNLIHEGTDFDVYLDQGKEFRCYKTSSGYVYAMSEYDMQKKQGSVFYSHEEKDLINHGAACLRFAAFEQMMISAGRVLLHAACVDTTMGGLLFSGISGIGKTTQADLWIKYRNAVMINGDRPIVYEQDGQWLAAGSPYAGSSHCYVNQSVQIKGIVFLQQAKVNNVRRLKSSESFTHIYRHVVANTWNAAYMEKMLELVMQMAQSIPCYLLACTPDEEAVIYLEKYLGEEK